MYATELSQAQTRLATAKANQSNEINSDRAALVSHIQTELGLSPLEIIEDPANATVKFSGLNCEVWVSCSVTAAAAPEDYGVAQISNVNTIGLSVKAYGKSVDYGSWKNDTNPGTPPGGQDTLLVIGTTTITRQTEAATEDIAKADFIDWLYEKLAAPQATP